MGYVVGSRCYSAQSEAHDAYFGSMGGVVSFTASNQYETTFVPAASVGRSAPSGWSRQTVEYTAAGVPTGVVNYVDLASVGFPSCTPAEPFTDGVAVGWGFGAALIMVAALKMMSKGAR